MQFIKDWDAVLIEELTNCNSVKPILSVYPPDFESKPVTLAMCSNGFNSMGVPLFKARPVKPFKRPIVSNFWAAGFSFSEGSVVTECGYLERIGDVFFGEEIFQMKQFWNRGYQLYSPSREICKHLWSSKYRSTFADDHSSAERR